MTFLLDQTPLGNIYVFHFQRLMQFYCDVGSGGNIKNPDKTLNSPRSLITFATPLRTVPVQSCVSSEHIICYECFLVAFVNCD